MEQKILELLSVETLAEMNSELAKAYQSTKNQAIKDAARLVYDIGCKKAGSEKEYHFYFERTSR